MQPLCFVLMPFGKKNNSTGQTVDFDAVYSELIFPAIKEATLEPLRADEEVVGGLIHKPMFERLILCDYAVADLTTANANVFYELGVRHAVRPFTTVLLFNCQGQLPFDVTSLRAIPYDIGADGKPSNHNEILKELTRKLIDARNAKTDSPVYQLVEGFPDIKHLKTDVFREKVAYSIKIRDKLAAARKLGKEAVHKIQDSLGDIKDLEAAIVIDLFLSYRSVQDYEAMIALVPLMSPPLSTTTMVREQLGFALNRADKPDEAEKVLLQLIDEKGPSSETYGILGRVYKDRWDDAIKAGDEFAAAGYIDKAINAYLKGFETDWRDAYPGINAVTLMEIRSPPDHRKDDILPVVQYGIERRIANGNPNYWDYATLLELAVLRKQEEKAYKAFGDSLTSIREKFEPETTANNLRIIRQAREKRDENIPWALKIELELKKRI